MSKLLLLLFVMNKMIYYIYIMSLMWYKHVLLLIVQAAYLSYD